MGGSDKSAENHPSREEILAQHEPIHTYPRPRRKPIAGLVVPALVCGGLFGLILPLVWLGIVGALLDPLGVNDDVWFPVGLLIPPVALLVWAALREREHELYPATKAFLAGMFIGWLLFALAVRMFLVD